MAEFPSLPIWTDALLGDTQHLDTEQFGAYLLMLIVAWRAPTNDLPTDDRQLATITRLSKSKWLKTKTVLLAFWKEENGRYRQKNLDKVKNSVREIAQKNKAKSDARWLKHKETGNAAAMPQDIPNGYQNDALQNQNQIEDIGRIGLAKISPLEIGMEFNAFWNEYPKKSGRITATNAYKKAREEGADHATIIAGAKRYAEYAKGTAERYLIPPDKWLDGGHWSDEYRDSNAAKPINGKPNYADSIKSAVGSALDNIRAQDEIRAQSKQG